MRILVAADKFKGTLTALEAGEAIGRGLEGALGAEGRVVVEVLPVADGGEGTAEAVRAARGGERVECEVDDPLGRTVTAEYALVQGPGGERIGVLEMSQASGLWRLDRAALEPELASTFGTGEMMRAAVERGATRLMVGIGGSATNDGGAGMAEALGYRFYDVAKGQLMVGLPAGMERLGRLEAPGSDILSGVSVEVACDVTNPLLGLGGATRIYGAQKGVASGAMEFFEDRLERLAGVVERDLGVENRRGIAGAGAAGGLGWGLMVFCGGRLRRGFEMVADAIGLEARVAAADLVVTGEGRIDVQSAMGKAPGGVAAMAREHGKPVLAIGGAISLEGEDREAVAESFDLTLSIEEVFPEVGLEERIARNGELLEACILESSELMKKFATGLGAV